MGLLSYMSKGSYVKYWLITFWNQEIIQNHQSYFARIFEENEEKIQYFIYQVERAPDTGRDHVQAYVCFKNRIRLSGVKKLFKDHSLHGEVRRGSHEQARDYCSKKDTRVDGPFVFGDDPGSRKRKLDDIKASIDGGATDLEIASEYFGQWCRYYKAFREYRMLKQKPRDFKTEVRVYYGPSGVGKSRRATYEAGPNAYRKPRDDWWDGYDGVSNVIIDDFYGWIRFDELLRCLDRYSHLVPIKGGHVNFAPRLLIITSNVEPRQWYRHDIIDDYRFTALVRRMDVVEEMTETWTEPEKEGDPPCTNKEIVIPMPEDHFSE